MIITRTDKCLSHQKIMKVYCRTYRWTQSVLRKLEKRETESCPIIPSPDPDLDL